MHVTVTPLKADSQTRNYSYLIFDAEGNGEAVVIDPSGDVNVLCRTLVQYGLQLKAILITHTHFDHIVLVGALIKMYQCKVYVSDRELLPLVQYQDYLVPIADERNLEVAGLMVHPIRTPGHTLGSICYLIGSNLFTGDTLFIEGCGMCFGPNSDPKLLFRSLNRIKDIVLPDTCVFPGHSYGREPGMLFEYLLQHNIYLNFSSEEKFVAFRMRDGQRNLFAFR